MVLPAVAGCGAMNHLLRRCVTLRLPFCFGKPQFVRRFDWRLHRRLFLFSLTVTHQPRQRSIFAVSDEYPIHEKTANRETAASQFAGTLMGSQPKQTSVKEPVEIVSTRRETSRRAAKTKVASLLPDTMKKFLIFILILSLLIVSEYYFFTEIFTQKRIPVIAVTGIVILLCLYRLIRIFKRSIVSS